MQVLQSQSRYLLFALPRYWVKARSLKGQDVQVKSKQGKLKEVPARPQSKLHEDRSQHHHEAHNHFRNTQVTMNLSFSFTELNLADNSISEYGMHAIKNLIGSTKI